ncbi:hypothetical protein [Selenomonas flueggei]|jgi:hypothetical protein|uniref:hypothetical protein n=1 Tax=Selenomonas flueggei TaxID=135080 RepID=UPI002672BD63|nr:hypothetical protein [Selenomonas flueggei]
MDEEKAVQKEARYTREALAASAKYRPCCDALMILLEEGKEYTFAEVDQMVEEFNGRTVTEATVGKE